MSRALSEGSNAVCQLISVQRVKEKLAISNNTAKLIVKLTVFALIAEQQLLTILWKKTEATKSNV